jgi:hypothetical protein
MFDNKYSRQQQRLEGMLGNRAEAEGRLTGFVQRTSKLTAVVFVQALVLTWLEKPTGSLTDVAQSCSELGVDISVPGLQQRLTASAVALLKGLFQSGLQQLPKLRRLPKGVLSKFRAIYVLDSTTLTLPEQLKGLFPGRDYKGSRASAKIQLSFDYVQGAMVALDVVGGCEADQNCQQHVRLAGPATLHLFDLGFFKQQVFEQLAQAGGYFISRLQTQTSLYDPCDAERALDLEALLSTAPAQGDVDVALGRLSQLKVRLIFQKLPASVVAERRRRAKRKARHKGYTCSARHMNLLAWSIFITNVPRDWLQATHIMLLYRLRWQVELIFKLWKSQAQLDQIAHYGPHRFLCQFYARLLALLVFHWLLDDFSTDDPSAELSLPKAFAIIQRYAARLRSALAHPEQTMCALLEKLQLDLHRLALKQKRRKSPSTLARILAAGL